MCIGNIVQTWIMRVAFSTTNCLSWCKSADSARREKCAWSSTFALVWGSVYLALSILRGRCMARRWSMVSSRWRMGMRPYSVAEHRISMMPFSLVVAVRDELKSSTVVYLVQQSKRILDHNHTKGNRRANASGTIKRSCARFGAHPLRKFLILPFFISRFSSGVTFMRNTNRSCYRGATLK